MSTLLNDCFVHDGQRMRHDDALRLLRDRVLPIAAEETVPLSAASGRIAARAVTASRSVPPATNSAVDGYAFPSAAYDRDRGATLPIVGRIAAGHPLSGSLSGASAVRIFTGGLLPTGCDTVAMQEDVTVNGPGGAASVTLPPGLRTGSNVRPAGEDVAAGETIIAAGRMLRPQDLAALASVGVAEVTCHRRLRVAILSTGDEVVPAGQGTLAGGQVFDANAPMLRAIIEANGASVTDLGVLPDKPDRIRAELAAAARHHDVIVSSGGVSRGEEDHLAPALEALGRRHLWQIAVKPGRPLAFGQIGSAVVVGLPGNPVAVFVCALLYLRPLLVRLGGGVWPEPRRYPLEAAFEFRGRKPGRREFWRGILVETPAGLAVDKFRRDGSGLISGLRASDGLIDIPEERGDVLAGETVAFIPYSELGLVGWR